MAIGLTEDYEGLHLLRIVSVVVSRLLAELGQYRMDSMQLWKAKQKSKI